MSIFHLFRILMLLIASTNSTHSLKNTNNNYYVYLKLFFPFIPVEKIKTKEKINLKNQNDKKQEVYGLFFNEDLNDIPLHLRTTKEEEEKFFKFINNNPIHINKKKVTFSIDKQYQFITFMEYRINKKSNINVYFLENFTAIKTNIQILEYKTIAQAKYQIKFTVKEKPLILHFFKTNKQIKNLWFIYENFEEIYGKHFIFFAINNKELSLEEAKSYFYWLFLGVIYEELATTLY